MGSIPDFLKDNRTEEEKKRAREWLEYSDKIDAEYDQKFPDSTPYLGLSDNMSDDEFYRMLEECIEKGKPMEELYPDYTLSPDEFAEGEFID
ncbi:MAG: hypothetical protein NC389_09795 [Acetatifactor muris]|nr:hypothetical protein [Acetatifactor muris]